MKRRYDDDYEDEEDSDPIDGGKMRESAPIPELDRVDFVLAFCHLPWFLARGCAVLLRFRRARTRHHASHVGGARGNGLYGLVCIPAFPLDHFPYDSTAPEFRTPSLRGGERCRVSRLGGVPLRRPDLAGWPGVFSVRPSPADISILALPVLLLLAAWAASSS